MTKMMKAQVRPGVAVTSGKASLRLLVASALVGVPVSQAATENTLTVTAETRESVTGRNSGLVAKESAAGTKTATPLRKTPQSISVVTREQMDDQAAASVSDALSYTSGVVTNYRGNSNRNDEIISRGFRYAPKLLDGLHYGLSSSSGGAGQIDPWLLERVEMVHGPAGVLYGQVSPGGLVVMTSKRPTAETVREVQLSSGNHHQGEAAFDFGGQLDDDSTLFYRLNGIASTRHEDVKNNKQERVAIAPAITWLPDADTSFTLLASYQNDPKAGSRNFLPMAGTLKAASTGYIPYDFNINDPNYYGNRREQASVGYEFDHSFNEAVSFTQNLRYTHRDEDYKYMVYTTSSPVNDHTIERRPQHETVMTNEVGVDNHLKGLFATGDVGHTLLGGLDYRWSRVASTLSRHTSSQYQLDWANPTRVDVDESDMSVSSNTLKQLHQVGVYLQDQMEWNHWNLVLSGRNDWSQIRTVNRLSATDEKQNDNKLTGRAGLLYAFDNGLSPYVSYSTSFEPNLSTGEPGSDPFKPTTGEQTELGVKFQPVGSNTVMTVSVFDITQKNITSVNPVTKYNEQIGKVKSKGLEAEIHAQPTPEVKLIAAYTYTDAVTKETYNATQLGHSPASIPRHAASAWGSYSFQDGVLSGLTVGTGVRYTGDAPADSTGTDEVPHFTLYDAMAKYELGEAVASLKGTTVQLNVQNLTDKHYVASCSGSEACFYGTGRNVVASVNYRW